MAKKPKLSAEDALSGIAHAMQGGEEVLGDSAQDKDQRATHDSDDGEKGWPWPGDVAGQVDGGNEGGAM